MLSNINLCGAVNTAETELLIPSVLTAASSDDGSTSTTRTTNSASAPRNNKEKADSTESLPIKTPSSSTPLRSRQSPSVPAPSQSPPLLNPLSKEDLKKSRSRRPFSPKIGSLKTISGLIKKLEDGCNVTMHDTELFKSQSIVIALEGDRVYLSVRKPIIVENKIRCGGSSQENELLLRLQLKNILRMEVGKTKSSGFANSHYVDIHPMKCFSIVMNSDKDMGGLYYNFEADSLIQREAIVSTVLVLLDQARKRLTLPMRRTSRDDSSRNSFEVTDEIRQYDSHSQGSLSPLKRTHIHTTNSVSHSMPTVTSNDSLTPDGQGTETTLVNFTPERRIVLPSLDDLTSEQVTSNTTASAADPDVGKFPTPSGAISIAIRESSRAMSSEDARDTSFAASEVQDVRDGDGVSAWVDHVKNGNQIQKSDSSDNPASGDNRQELPVKIIQSDSNKDEYVEVTENEKSYSGRPTKFTTKKQVVSVDSGMKSLSVAVNRRQSLVEQKGSESDDDDDDEYLDSPSVALTKVEDVTLGSIPNHMSGAWCADDICSLALNNISEACKGIFDIKHFFNGADGPKDEGQRIIVADYITGVLGAPTAMVNFFTDVDVWNVQDGPDKVAIRTKSRVVKNRAVDPNAQVVRIHKLRNEMTFEGARQSSRERMFYIQTVKSSDDLGRVSSSRKGQVTPNVNNLFDTPVFLDVMTKMTKKRDTNLSCFDNEDVVCYDSDPEHSRPRTISREGPRRVRVEIPKELKKKQDDGGNDTRKGILSSVPAGRLASGRRLRKMDENAVAEIVEAMKNEKMTLMWHPTQTKSSSNRPPLCVKVWIESGVYLVDGTFLLPKLTWVPMYEGGLGSKVLNVAMEEPERLDLLDVCRVREVDKVDRRLHPFARANRSFMIQTQSQILLFETETTEERVRVVNGLKIVIARLASLLMLRDLRAVDEFFGAGVVPGEAPTWAKSGK